MRPGRARGAAGTRSAGRPPGAIYTPRHGPTNPRVPPAAGLPAVGRAARFSAPDDPLRADCDEAMLDWLRRKRLSNEARRKLLVITARSEEALVETHVSNVLYLLRELGAEVDVHRGIELYAEMIPMEEAVAQTVANRVLARHDSGPLRGERGEKRFRGVFRDGE